MSNQNNGLGDLPPDLGTDHGRRLRDPGIVESRFPSGRVPGGPVPGQPGQAGQPGQVPFWVSWLLKYLEPYLDRSVHMSVRPLVIGTEARNVSGARKRKYLLIQNLNAAGRIWVNFGGTAVAQQCHFIDPGGYYEPEFPPDNEISIVADFAAMKVIFNEGL